MAARSEAEVTSHLVYKSPAWKGGVLYWQTAGQAFQDLANFILRYWQNDYFHAIVGHNVGGAEAMLKRMIFEVVKWWRSIELSAT